MPPSVHVILAALGTDGDVLPFAGLGAALRRRGHRATLAAAEDYRDLAEGSGLSCLPPASRPRTSGDSATPPSGTRSAGRC